MEDDLSFDFEEALSAQPQPSVASSAPARAPTPQAPVARPPDAQALAVLGHQPGAQGRHFRQVTVQALAGLPAEAGAAPQLTGTRLARRPCARTGSRASA